MKRVILILLTLGIGLSLFGQTKEVSGVVKDSDGFPLPGVTVMIKGTTTGTITDIDGNYSIKVFEGATLQFSFLGMESQEVPVGQGDKIDIVLSEEVGLLDEFVVVGYGAKKREDIIGSQTTVKGEELGKVASTTLQDGLAGTSSGMMVTSSSGEIGSSANVQIRGLNSINLDSKPLWVIDGVVVGENGMDLINPNDILSLEVLKDAKATAIYGSRGSSGVILITTKSGKKGKTNTNISYKGGINTMSQNYEKMNFANTSEYFSIMDKARENSGQTALDPQVNILDPSFKAVEGDPIDLINRYQAEGINHNYFDEILQNGKYNELNFSNSSGFEKGDYFISGMYKDITGIIAGNDFTQISMRANLNYELAKNLTMSLKTTLAHTDKNSIPGGAYGTFTKANTTALPWYPIYQMDNYVNDSTPYLENSSEYWNARTGNNLVANKDVNKYSDNTKKYRGIGNASVTYALPWDWSKGLVITASGAVDFTQQNQISWSDAEMNTSENVSKSTDQSSTSYFINYNLFINYNRTFYEDHNFDLTLGTESSINKGWSRYMSAKDLTSEYEQIGSPSNPPNELLEMYSYLSGEDYLRSYFGRFDYKFREKYMLGVSFRRDGSSRFSGDNRWGTFAAYSAGWLMMKEDFMSSLKPIFNNLKLRGSYGQTGNNRISSSAFYNTFVNSNDTRYGLQTDIFAGTYMSNIGNSTLTWESTNSLDLGLDYGIKKDRINGSIAYYKQNIEDLLLKVDMPPSAIVGSYWDNIGKFNNSGFEFSISSTNVNKPMQQLKWTTDFNFSTNKNEVVELTDSDQNWYISGRNIIMEGQELRTFYMAEWAGLDKETGVDMIYAIDYDVWESESKIVYLTDANGDKLKIPATQTNIDKNKVIHEGKSATPSYYGGLGNKVSYKNLDFSFRLTFAGGHYIYDYIEQRACMPGDGTFNVYADLLENSWSEDNKDAKYPRLVWNYAFGPYYTDQTDIDNVRSIDPDYVNDSWDAKSTSYSRFLYRGDYIRLKSIEVGYNFPDHILEKLHMNRLRVYASATNLLTYAFYFDGWDPETGDSSIPPLRTYNIGINIGL